MRIFPTFVGRLQTHLILSCSQNTQIEIQIVVSFCFSASSQSAYFVNKIKVSSDPVSRRRIFWFCLLSSYLLLQFLAMCCVVGNVKRSFNYCLGLWSLKELILQKFSIKRYRNGGQHEWKIWGKWSRGFLKKNLKIKKLEKLSFKKTDSHFKFIHIHI